MDKGLDNIPTVLHQYHEKFVLVIYENGVRTDIKGNHKNQNWDIEKVSQEQIKYKKESIICSKIVLPKNIICIDVDEECDIILNQIKMNYNDSIGGDGNSKGFHRYYLCDWIDDNVVSQTEVFKNYKGDFFCANGNNWVFENVDKKWNGIELEHLDKERFMKQLNSKGLIEIFKSKNRVVKKDKKTTTDDNIKKKVMIVIKKYFGDIYNSCNMCIDNQNKKIQLANLNNKCFQGEEHKHAKDILYINENNIVSNCKSSRCEEGKIVPIPDGFYDELYDVMEWEKASETDKEKTENIKLVVDDFYAGSLKFTRKILPLIKNRIVYCCKKWYVVDDNNLWIITDKPYGYILPIIEKCIDRGCDDINKKINNTSIKTSKEVMKMYRLELQNQSGLHKQADFTQLKQGVIENMMRLLLDNEFYIKIDNLPYYIAFRNGLYNIKTKKLERQIEPTDYITKRLDYDYKEERNKEDEKWLLHEIKKICNWNDEHTKYMLNIIAYAFTGDAKRYKHIYNFIGQTASNGKTTILSAIDSCFPCYVGKFNSDLLDEKCSSKAHKHLMDIKGVRIFWCEEMKASAILDERMLKMLGDGEKIKNEVLFGTTEEIYCRGKCFTAGNSGLRFSKMDEGIARRIQVSQLDSHFSKDHKEDDYENKTFKVDAKMDEKIFSKRMSLFHILMDYAYDVYTNGLMDMPKEYQDEVNETINTNKSKIAEWLDENIDLKAVGFFTSVKQIKEQYEESGEKANGSFNREVIDYMKRKKVKYDSQMRKSIEGNKHKGFFKDIKIA